MTLLNISTRRSVRDLVNFALKTDEVDSDGKLASRIPAGHETKRDTPKRRDNIENGMRIH